MSTRFGHRQAEAAGGRVGGWSARRPAIADTLFSSRRESIKSSWWRFTQPATVSRGIAERRAFPETTRGTAASTDRTSAIARPRRLCCTYDVAGCGLTSGLRQTLSTAERFTPPMLPDADHEWKRSFAIRSSDRKTGAGEWTRTIDLLITKRRQGESRRHQRTRINDIPNVLVCRCPRTFARVHQLGCQIGCQPSCVSSPLSIALKLTLLISPRPPS